MSEVIYRRDIHDQIDSPVKAHSDCLGLASWYAHLKFDIWRDLQDAWLVKLCLFQRVDLTSNHKRVSIVEKREYPGLGFILVQPVFNRHSGINHHGGLLHA